jgi:hypothetical protein
VIDVDEYMRVNLKKHAAIAWKGYLSNGRGAVITRIHFPDNDASKAVIGQSLEYRSEDDLLVNGCSGDPIDEVRRYDPRTEVVALAIWPDGGVSISRVGPLPKDFFRASDQ